MAVNITQAEEDPRPDWDDRESCQCGEKEKTCSTNLCQKCVKFGYTCLETCGCQPRQRCHSVFTKLNTFVTPGILTLRANPCFIGHLKKHKDFDILSLARRLMGGENAGPVAAIFDQDPYLMGWARSYRPQPGEGPAQTLYRREQLHKDLIIYGLMESQIDPLPRKVRYSLCRERWVNCDAVKHCWWCEPPRGCHHVDEPEEMWHWHCSCKNAKHQNKDWKEQCKKCGGWSEKMGERLNANFNANTASARTRTLRANPMIPRLGAKRAVAYSPEASDTERMSKKYHAGGMVGDPKNTRQSLQHPGYESDSESDEEEEYEPAPTRPQPRTRQRPPLSTLGDLRNAQSQRRVMPPRGRTVPRGESQVQRGRPTQNEDAMQQGFTMPIGSRGGRDYAVERSAPVGSPSGRGRVLTPGRNVQNRGATEDDDENGEEDVALGSGDDDLEDAEGDEDTGEY
ncbi:MAG: hypothetical protein MMC33_005070 [Icmadophila ericetorum]|nr:hypothetical protein [Icmadophila ericetorum]